MMNEAIRKTKYELRVQKELDEKLLNKLKCLICSELLVFVSILFLLFLFMQFIMFLNYLI
jgi:hypothetical protein